MSGQKDIAELRRRLFGGADDDEPETFYATVRRVDEARRTCTVEAEEVPYEEVLLHAVADAGQRGLCLIPAVGSLVLVSRIGGSNELYVAMLSEVDRVLLTVGDEVSATIDAERVAIDGPEIILNGGTHGGVVQVEELRRSLDSLKGFVEAMHAALPTAFTAIGAALSANGSAGKTAYDGAMAGRSIVIEEMENPKVKH